MCQYTQTFRLNYVLMFDVVLTNKFVHQQKYLCNWPEVSSNIIETKTQQMHRRIT